MLYLIIGYVLAVLFPIPFVNSTIIDLWTKLGEKFKSWSATNPVSPQAQARERDQKPPMSF